MAEVVGLVTNIAAVLELTAKIARLSYSYACDVKNAPKTQKQYLQEVSALMEVLFRVEQAVVESESTGLLPSRPSSLDEDALMDCYKELSGLHFELERRKSRFLRPFQDRELRPHIDRLQKFRALFADYLSSCILVAATATYKKVSMVHHEQDRNLLLTWVPTPNIPLRQKPSPCPGTGSWFLTSDAVQTWLNRSSKLLWCHGPPGVGKSFLASVAIDHLLAKQKQNFLVIYFFCDFSSQNQVKTIDILHCLLRQIIDQGSGEMLSTLKESCGDPSTLQNANQVAQLLALAASVQPIYLVVDAPDEFKMPNELLGHILELAASEIHVMVTSRDLPQIRKKMKTALQLEIEPTGYDLRLYVNARLQESDFAEEATKDSSLIDDIVSKTGNIFLLSRLLLDELLDLVTVHQIRKALQRPQQGLQQALEATLQRIDAQPSARRTLARRLLGWIMLAERRLKLDEVVTAFAVEDGEELQRDNMPSPDILHQVCAGLVVLNKDDNTLGFVHAFAYEFLRGFLPDKEINTDMARTCLRYLSLKPLTAGPCASSAEVIERLDSLAFLEYSSKYWGRHLIAGECEKELETLVMKILGDAQLRNSAFQALQFRREYASTGLVEELFQSLPTKQEALHLAAYWGLIHITGRLLETGAHPSAADSQKWTPLHWACANDKLAVAELLVRSGGNANAQDIQGWTPLFWGSFVGSLDMVRLLLSNGANHLVRSTLGWTALHWAISGGHTEIVRELLDHHSKCQASEPVLHTMTLDEIESYSKATLPVHVAAAGQDANIFTMLIDHLETPRGMIEDAKFNMIWEREGFDVPVSVNPWRTMTKSDRINGREARLPKLTGAYADDSQRWRSCPKEWKSVLLLSAIRDQQLSSVQLLVKAGADVNYNNALCVAACRRDPRYVQCLLENGADPNAMDSFGRTALHEAVMNGFVETIAALLDGGGDVNRPVSRDSDSHLSSHQDRTELAGYSLYLNDNGSTALIQACGFLRSASRRGQSRPELTMQITRLLLSKGADTRLRDLSGRTVLHYVLLLPHLPLVRLLIESGCPVDATDCDGRTPLHMLAICKEDDLSMPDLKETACLLLNGKYENAQTNLLEQSLRVVPANEGKPTRKGNWSSKLRLVEGSDEGLTPLGLALQAGRWKMVQVLLDLGATFPADLDLTPILDHAVRSVELSMTSLLLQLGARPLPGAIHILASSFVKQATTETLGGDTCAKFKHILNELASAGADVNFRPGDAEDTDESKETPLTLVAKKRGFETILKELLDAGADVCSASSKTFDPILSSALFGEVGDLACLLDHAAAHPKEDHWSKHLRDFSKESDLIKRVCLCLQKADVVNCTSSNGRTLLHLAAEQGDIALVTSLISCGAKPNIADDNGWLAVHCSGFAKQTVVLKFLLLLSINESSNLSTESSAEQRHSKLQEILNKEDNSSTKETMFDVAVSANNIDIVSLLLQLGMDPNSVIKDYTKQLPVLSYAAEQGQTEILSLLLHHGADIEREDPCGWRPLHAACFSGHAEIAKILIEAGADVHAATVSWNGQHVKPTGLYQGTPWTGQPLHLAAMSGQVEIVQLLLEKGVDIHASTGADAHSYSCPGHGPTALHLALDTGLFYCRRGKALDQGRLQIAQLLVDRGAMVRGVIRRYSLQNILDFRGFSDLWDALVAGDAA